MRVDRRHVRGAGHAGMFGSRAVACSIRVAPTATLIRRSLIAMHPTRLLDCWLRIGLQFPLRQFDTKARPGLTVSGLPWPQRRLLAAQSAHCAEASNILHSHLDR